MKKIKKLYKITTGYKGMKYDFEKDAFYCRRKKFEIGRTYSIRKNKKIEICQTGFHFCELLTNVSSHYNVVRYSFYFKVRSAVKVKSDFKTDESKTAVRDISILEMISKHQVLPEFYYKKISTKKMRISIARLRHYHLRLKGNDDKHYIIFDSIETLKKINGLNLQDRITCNITFYESSYWRCISERRLVVLID